MGLELKNNNNFFLIKSRIRFIAKLNKYINKILYIFIDKLYKI